MDTFLKCQIPEIRGGLAAAGKPGLSGAVLCGVSQVEERLSGSG